ncbi:MAG: AraC family transcriptional regulator [Lentisphaeria bacterium]|nr:AraC family transcriptional regulator [Lentisphaeria bacterium]
MQQILPCEIFSVPFDKTDLLHRLMDNAVIGTPDTTEGTLEVNLLCRMLLNEFFLCPQFLAHTQTQSIPVSLRRTAEYIRQNCDAKISIQELAALARMTQVQFTRQFVKYYHQTPKEYCCNARVDHAKTLLMQTALSTKEIAARCGFSDCYHFYHQFKKKTSITPSEYREANKIRH